MRFMQWVVNTAEICSVSRISVNNHYRSDYLTDEIHTDFYAGIIGACTTALKTITDNWQLTGFVKPTVSNPIFPPSAKENICLPPAAKACCME